MMWRSSPGLSVVYHCFCFLAADMEVVSQEAWHAVGFLCYPVYMRFPVQVVNEVST